MRSIRVRWPLVTVGLVVVAALGAVAHRVTANAPPGRYTIPGDGTVIDTKTHLVWQQTAPAQALTFTQAASYCSQNMASLPTGPSGSAPWRLPNMKELQTIVDESQASAPLVDPSFAIASVDGGQVSSLWFWTSSTSPGLPAPWIIDFNTGWTDIANSSPMTVRCVR